MDMKCPYCGALYEVEQKECGNIVKCEICGMSFVIDQKIPDKQSSTGSIFKTVFMILFGLVLTVKSCKEYGITTRQLELQKKETHLLKEINDLNEEWITLLEQGRRNRKLTQAEQERLHKISVRLRELEPKEADLLRERINLLREEIKAKKDNKKPTQAEEEELQKLEKRLGELEKIKRS